MPAANIIFAIIQHCQQQICWLSIFLCDSSLAKLLLMDDFFIQKLLLLPPNLIVSLKIEDFVDKKKQTISDGGYLKRYYVVDV